jgi:hypothetical protein
MKKTVIGIILIILGAAGAFAQEEKAFHVTVDIDADLAQYQHTDIKNDEYVSDEDTIQENQIFFLRNGSFGDAEVKFEYTGPGKDFGAVLGLDIGDTLAGNVPWGDVYAWSNITRFARIQLGKFTYRAIAKIGGDKDLGVLDLNMDKPSNTFALETSDSLAQQADVIGFLGSGIIGPVEIGAFAAPNAYFTARHFQVPGTITGDEPEQTVPAYYTYNFGGYAKFSLPDLVDVGASYRQIHTEGSGTYTGEIFHDFGLYAVLGLLKNIGVEIGAGYSGRIAYDDGDDIGYAPFKSGIHLDAVYSGIPNLKVGLYNNLSLYTLDAENSRAYDEGIAKVSDIYADEDYLALYNELVLSYTLGRITPSLGARNYYAVLSGFKGVKEADYGLDELTVDAKVTFKVSESMEVRGGIKYVNTVYDTPKVSDVLVNSNFVIAIPVGITFKW